MKTQLKRDKDGNLNFQPVEPKQPKALHTKVEWVINTINSDVIEITPKNDWRPIVQLTTFDRSRPDYVQSFEQIDANAQRIVKCVNMHDELVLMLSVAKSCMPSNSSYHERIDKILKQSEQE